MSTRALSFGASRKRKERDGADCFRAPPEPAHKPILKPIHEPKPIFKPVLEPKQMSILKPTGNRILAGYMAHEFLSSGTLLGKPFPPTRADPSRPGSSSAQPSPGQTKPPAKAYADVSGLMMGEGRAHIPGVFNPTQLASWLQM